MTLEVLLVEDSLGDAGLTRQAVSEASGDVELHVVNDGLEAMAYLKREGSHDRANRPDLILLGLNLPTTAGREVLSHIKGDDDLKIIPIVVLAAADNDVDILESYCQQANCYLSKPVESGAFKRLIKNITEFWMTKARLPQKNHD
jgi:CheY-like chemotaxis protein